MKETAIIGPGRLGTTIAEGLHHAGYRIVAVAGRGARDLERFTERFPDASAVSAADAARDADMIVVALPDDDVPVVLERVADDDAIRPGQRWVQVAADPATAQLETARAAGACAVAVRPGLALTDDIDRNYAALPGTVWAVAAGYEDLGWASVLVTDLRGSPTHVAGGPAIGSPDQMLAMATDVLPGTPSPAQGNSEERQNALETLTSIYRSAETIRDAANPEKDAHGNHKNED